MTTYRLLFFGFFLLIISCEAETESELKQKTTYFLARVDNLRIRNAPNLDGEVVATIPEWSKLKGLNEISKNKDKIVLRGQEYNSPWIKVQFNNRELGWVYGGALVELQGEYFDDFKKKYLADKKFQISRIRFPLEEGSGLFDHGETMEYTKENWPYDVEDIKDIPVKYPDLKVEITRTENTVEEFWYLPNSGFGGRTWFEKINGKWFLTKQIDTNM